jgi:hypothetical protein
MLIPVKYHKRNYPPHIRAEIDEVAGHFDVFKVSATRKFSLHTEYSYGKRKLESELLKKLSVLKNAQKDGVPQLWYSKQWAVAFAEFIKLLCDGEKPTIIEIHPPFSDYAETIEIFLQRYQYFEELVLSEFPCTMILLENRSGSIYKGGKFIISKGRDLRSLCDQISKKNLRLRIALDIPQLLTSYGGPGRLEPEEIRCILDRQNYLQAMTSCIHLWGKKTGITGRLVSHSGDLNTFFRHDIKKNIFLKWMSTFLHDGKSRYFVPEVNSSDSDLESIINDLEEVSITFV